MGNVLYLDGSFVYIFFKQTNFCMPWFCFDLALGISKLSAIIGQGDKALLILGKVCTYKVQTFAKEQKSERNFLEIHSWLIDWLIEFTEVWIRKIQQET